MKDFCHERQEQISMLLSGDLPREERKNLEQHFNQCPSCSEYFQRIRKDDELFSEFVEHMKTSVTRIEKKILENLDHDSPRKQAKIIPIWKRFKKTTVLGRNGKRVLGIAAAVLVVTMIFAVIGYLPFFHNPKSGNTAWWLGPRVVWAEEIEGALNKVKAVTCREQMIFVSKDGSRHNSTTISWFTVSHDSYVRTIYDGDNLREIQSYTPQDGGMTQTSVRFDTGTYMVLRHKGSFGHRDPVERMHFYVGLIDKADCLIGSEIIDGTKCVGFEISASKYGNNPENWIDRIWFDVETKLPVRIQKERPKDSEGIKATIWVQDQFKWNPSLADDFFTPEIPAGYIQAHPDDIRSDEHSDLGSLGLVIAINLRDDSLSVVSTLPESPASREGVLKGDKIIEIDGANTEGMHIEKAIKLLRGEPGTKAHIKIFRPANQSTVDYNIARELLQAKKTRSHSSHRSPN